MKIIFNKFIPFPGFRAINIFGVLFARHGAKIDDRTISHEMIHTAQIKECYWLTVPLFIVMKWDTFLGGILNLLVLAAPFYWLYLLEWLVKLLFYGRQAYRMISFEREAYSNEHFYEYTQHRKAFSFLKYIFL
ncbi:hypothetical protein [Leadbetterella byssophila]|uniref:hypothetical protein n=1 Tax=Leadbetterella byssophila TaxID=316068 RepID=UPI0039A14E43